MKPSKLSQASIFELEQTLARAHGCPRGCPDCEHAASQHGVPDLIARWAPFVTSDAAHRLAKACRDHGRPFPRLSPDDVVQFCIEEACMERLHYSDILTRIQGHAGPAEDYTQAADPELDAALGKAREFARTGTP